MKNKARKCVREYEVKLEELKNECHEAWISLQDSNRINEMLRDDLCAKSLCCDSLGRFKLNTLGLRISNLSLDRL